MSAASVAEILGDILVIDVDTHLTEPHDLWTSRAPKGWEERVPRVKEIDGRKHWVVDDEIFGFAAGSAVIRPDGSKAFGTDFYEYTLEDVHPAAYDVEARLAFMDGAGIHAQIVYPNVVGFGGQRFATVVDPELRMLCATLYNDAAAEIQERSGDRLFPMALLPWWDIDAAVREVARAKAMGLRGVNTNSDPQTEGLPDLAEAHWDPLWEVCADLEMPVNFHIGSSDMALTWFTGGPWPSLDDERKLAFGSVMMLVSNLRTMGNILISGMLERHPKLQIVSVESGLGWVPFLLEALDYQIVECAPHAAEQLSMPPSDYFRRQIHTCYWFERRDLQKAINALGADNIMFETDFPHPTCLYPDGLERAADAVTDLDPAVRRKLFSTNASELYKIPV